MVEDLVALFNEWPHDPNDESKNVRCVIGEDGRRKLQVRVRCGVFQWEYEGRPDGSTPYGYPSLLDYHRERIERLERQAGSADSLRLDKAEVEEIGEELLDYYHRRVLFFRIDEYQRARSDAEHNLALMDIIRSYVDDDEAILQHEKWRPFVTMDHARADALVSCQKGAYQECIQKLNRGIDEIAGFYRYHGRDDLIDVSQEIAALKDLKLKLRESYGIPLSREEVLEGLRDEQAKAIADEDYERAARIRDEIARFENDEGPEAA